MGYSFLTFEEKKGVGVISLNRPDKGNAIDLQMARELLKAANHCDEAAGIRAVVLTGKGNMFCAGGDLKTFADQGEEVSQYIKEVTQAFHAAISRFNWMDAPAVAAVNGTAAGAGLSLALSTDIAIAGESAKFTMAYTKVGLSINGGASYFLPRLVGLRRAKEMALLNPVLSAKQAMDWGIINQVVNDEEVVNTAMDMAYNLAKGPTFSLGVTKRLILAGVTESLESQMEKETRKISTIASSTDGREGVAAFIAKRHPEFQGK